MKLNLDRAMKNDQDRDSSSHQASIVAAIEKAKEGKSLFKEVTLLSKRHLLTQCRNPSYSFMRLSALFGVSLYKGIIFHLDKLVTKGAVLSIGAIFFMVFVLAIPMQANVVPLIEDRALLFREATFGLYSRFSYDIGQVLAYIPFHALHACCRHLFRST
jgi:hypothetical protein